MCVKTNVVTSNDETLVTSLRLKLWGEYINSDLSDEADLHWDYWNPIMYTICRYLTKKFELNYWHRHLNYKFTKLVLI